MSAEPDATISKQSLLTGKLSLSSLPIVDVD